MPVKQYRHHLSYHSIGDHIHSDLNLTEQQLKAFFEKLIALPEEAWQQRSNESECLDLREVEDKDHYFQLLGDGSRYEAVIPEANLKIIVGTSRSTMEDATFISEESLMAIDTTTNQPWMTMVNEHYYSGGEVAPKTDQFSQLWKRLETVRNYVSGPKIEDNEYLKGQLKRLFGTAKPALEQVAELLYQTPIELWELDSYPAAASDEMRRHPDLKRYRVSYGPFDFEITPETVEILSEYEKNPYQRQSFAHFWSGVNPKDSKHKPIITALYQHGQKCIAEQLERERLREEGRETARLNSLTETVLNWSS